MTTLAGMLHEGAKIQDVASWLDGLEPEQRAEEVRRLPRRDQELLYRCAADAPPLDLEHFVPAEVPDGREVRHLGMNSQPLFRSFEKRFCRPADEPEGRLMGYNETPVRRVIGPGYFVARPARTQEGAPDPRGAVVVDYFLEPAGPVPPGWPEIVPNAQGLQRFVYHRTRDYMRRVSRHVSVGEAWRLESRVMGWFVLCRREG